MKTYEQIVELYRKNRTREMISNGSRTHGAVIFSNIFSAARAERLDIRIVTATLLKEFYDDFAARAATHLLSNRIDIILVGPDRDQLKNNAFLDAVVRSPNGSIAIAEESSEVNHFILAGKTVYRLETDHHNGIASANFNDPTVGTWLFHRFDALKKNSSPYLAAIEANGIKLSLGKMDMTVNNNKCDARVQCQN